MKRRDRRVRDVVSNIVSATEREYGSDNVPKDLGAGMAMMLCHYNHTREDYNAVENDNRMDMMIHPLSPYYAYHQYLFPARNPVHDLIDVYIDRSTNVWEPLSVLDDMLRTKNECYIFGIRDKSFLKSLRQWDQSLVDDIDKYGVCGNITKNILDVLRENVNTVNIKVKAEINIMTGVIEIYNWFTPIKINGTDYVYHNIFNEVWPESLMLELIQTIRDAMDSDDREQNQQPTEAFERLCADYANVASGKISIVDLLMISNTNIEPVEQTDGDVVLDDEFYA